MSVTSIFRALKTSSNLMLLGFLSSFFGTMLVEGSVPSMVALGFLPLAWVPVYSTLTRLLDSSSVFVARYLARFRAGSILVFCECADIFLSALAILVIWSVPVNPALVLSIYILSVSFLPTLVDLAEEMYAENISRVSESAALNFNATVLMLVPAVSLIVAKPLGSLVVESSILLLILANAVFSAAGLFFRLASLRCSDLVELQVGNGSLDKGSSRTRFRTELLSYAPGAALLVPTISLTSGLTSMYLVIWISQYFENAGGAIAFFIMIGGVGMVFGPWLGRRFIRVYKFSTNVAGCLFVLLMLNLVAFFLALSGCFMVGGRLIFIVLSSVYLFSSSVFASWIYFVNVTARQKRYSGGQFASALGLSHTLSSVLFMLGSWLGLALDVAGDPTPAFMVIAIVLVIPLWAMDFKDELRFEKG
ncbi:MFS transporter [Salinicola lusitanus]|uniref:MFS transporter n=1 Tax=Salinicola lusitanus TaxID=1949085 RepID=UPI0013002FBF|nr:MFS transporter [Salinicola lusitanus]